MDSSPLILYKYFGPDRVDVLRNCLIRYSPFGAFNDPFEGQPEVTSLATEAGVRDSINAMLSEETKISYNQLPAEERAMLSYELWEQLVVQQLKSKESEIVQDVLGHTPTLRDQIWQSLNRQLGALCLSEVPDSLLMWSHYGASHTGFVLAFDTRHPYFHEKKGPDDELRHLRRVLYREARPSATLVEFHGVDFLLVKSGHWSYEREWRIFRALQDAEVVIPGEPFSVHLFPFPPSALKEVILGARTTAKTVSAVAECLRVNSALGHVRLRRASPDSSHFLLRINDEAI